MVFDSLVKNLRRERTKLNESLLHRKPALSLSMRRKKLLSVSIKPERLILQARRLSFLARKAQLEHFLSKNPILPATSWIGFFFATCNLLLLVWEDEFVFSGNGEKPKR